MRFLGGVTSSFPSLCALRPACGPLDAPVAPVKPAKPRVLPPPKKQPAPVEPEPLWHVILLNDDEHTFTYVIHMLTSIFGHSVERAVQMAIDVHENGRVIVATVHKELAELRQEQIHEYGPDPDVKDCPGSMRADIEPAA